MPSVNKVILIGHLGRDPEMRYTASGVGVANFSMAVSEKFKDRDGNSQEKTEWVKIVAWNKLAEICGEYLHKGNLVYIEGKLQTRTWEDNEGQKKYSTEVVAREMKMLSSPGGNKEKPAAESNTAESNTAESNTDAGPPEEDIPF